MKIAVQSPIPASFLLSFYSILLSFFFSCNCCSSYFSCNYTAALFFFIYLFSDMYMHNKCPRASQVLIWICTNLAPSRLPKAGHVCFCFLE